MPKVTVVMACYNAMPYLPEAIDSVLHQTYRDFQLVIVNDGSTDGSGDYLNERFSTSDPRVVVAHQVNQGQQVACNHAIAISDSEYISRIDADDVAEPGRFEKQIPFLDAHPEIGLSGGQIRRVGSNKAGLISNFPLDHESILEGLLRNHHTLANGTTVFRRDLFNKLGGYWKHNISEDWDLFLRLAEVSQLANQPDCFLSYRHHAQSVNGRRIVEAQLYNEYAADSFKRRQANAAPITYEEFFRQHRFNKWHDFGRFYLDAKAIGQYREAVGEIYSGKPIKGYARLGLSMLMSPTRTLRRVANMLTKRN